MNSDRRDWCVITFHVPFGLNIRREHRGLRLVRVWAAACVDGPVGEARVPRVSFSTRSQVETLVSVSTCPSRAAFFVSDPDLWPLHANEGEERTLFRVQPFNIIKRKTSALFLILVCPWYLCCINIYIDFRPFFFINGYENKNWNCILKYILMVPYF